VTDSMENGALIGAGAREEVTLGEMVAAVRAMLLEAGIVDGEKESKSLVADILGIEKLDIITNPTLALSIEQLAMVRSATDRRARGEPLSRIAGRRSFWSIDLELSEQTLDPRADTETVVEAALARIPKDRPVTIVDFGTGSGCLLLAVLSERSLAKGVGVDISHGAARTAQKNARALGLSNRAQFIVGDWGDALTQPVDVVLSNPPYIETLVIDGLDRTVRDFDPRIALDGGQDGLDAYRRIAPQVARLLKHDGFAAIEIGVGQGYSVCRILHGAGLAPISIKSDLSGTQRCVIAKKMLEFAVRNGTVR
jgi:release factor glutamine methyltransferase